MHTQYKCTLAQIGLISYYTVLEQLCSAHTCTYMTGVWEGYGTWVYGDMASCTCMAGVWLVYGT